MFEELKISSFIGASAILLGLPYFSGFIYLHSYYNFFGISVSELSLDESYIYINAFSVYFRGLVLLVQSEAFALSCLIAFLVFLVVVALDLTSFLGYKIGKLNASKLVIGYVITIVGMFVFVLLLAVF